MEDIIKSVKAGRISTLYYFSGESYPVQHLVETIRQKILGQEANAFNYDALQAKETSPEEIVSIARTMPMLGEKRLVLVREMHHFDAEALNKLLPYVKNPSPSTCLLMVADKADLRLKFFTELKKRGVVARFDPLKDREVPKWLHSEAKRRKITLQPGAAEHIAEAIGTDRAQLASALERLELYVGVGQPITPTDVEELLQQTRQRSIFELTNAVGRGQRRESLLVLHRMLQDREPGIKIVAMLARHIRLLWSTKDLVKERKSQKEIASQLGIHSFFVKDMIDQSKRFSEEKLRKIHYSLNQADLALKSSRLDDAVILQKLVMGVVPATLRGR